MEFLIAIYVACSVRVQGLTDFLVKLKRSPFHDPELAEDWLAETLLLAARIRRVIAWQGVVLPVYDPVTGSWVTDRDISVRRARVRFAMGTNE